MTLGLMRPRPDSTISFRDRAAVTWFYAGLLYGHVLGFTNPRGQWPGLPLSLKGGDWAEFIAASGGTIIGSLQSDARNALAATLAISEANALKISMNDMWKRYELAGF